LLQRAKLNEALQQGHNISTTLLNYRKDESTYWNKMQLYHINSRDEPQDSGGQRQDSGRPFLIIGIHNEVWFCSNHCNYVDDVDDCDVDDSDDDDDDDKF